MTDVPLRCACGRLRGIARGVTAADGTRVICYCDDCQAYARFLGRDDILDAWGGTDTFQTAPARVRLTEGTDELRCVRLSGRGMFRWYAGCCRTPIGNTVGPRVPFVGITHTFMDHAGDGRARDAVLGPPVARVHGAFAYGDVPAGVTRKFTVRVAARTVGMIARWWLARAGSPSPFFDAVTRAPRVAPQVLTPAERARYTKRPAA